MNAAEVHLALNHFPPIVDVAALIVLVIGMAWKSQPILRTACALALLAGLFVVPVFYSGDGAEHIVEHLDGVSNMAIEPHEDAADFAFAFLLVQGVAAIGALIAFRRRDIPRWAVLGLAVLILFTSTVVFRTAYLGGRIHHPETQMTSTP